MSDIQQLILTHLQNFMQELEKKQLAFLMNLEAQFKILLPKMVENEVKKRLDESEKFLHENQAQIENQLTSSQTLIESLQSVLNDLEYKTLSQVRETAQTSLQEQIEHIQNLTDNLSEIYEQSKVSIVNMTNAEQRLDETTHQANEILKILQAEQGHQLQRWQALANYHETIKTQQAQLITLCNSLQQTIDS